MERRGWGGVFASAPACKVLTSRTNFDRLNRKVKNGDKVGGRERDHEAEKYSAGR